MDVNCRPRRKGWFALCIAASITACGEEDNRSESLSTFLAGLCESVGGGAAQVSHQVSNVDGCFRCTLDNPAATIDTDYGSFALLKIPVAPTAGTARIRGTTQPGVVFPAGRSAGALIRTPAVGDAHTYQMYVSTYLNDQLQESGVAVQEQSPGAPIATGVRASRGRDAYYGIVTFNPYDAVELEFTQTVGCGGEGCGETRIYEICTR